MPELPNGKIRFAAIYAAGAAMGFTPQQIAEMSLWQYAAVIDGYNEAHGSDDNGLTQAEADDLAKAVLARMDG